MFENIYIVVVYFYLNVYCYLVVKYVSFSFWVDCRIFNKKLYYVFVVFIIVSIV